MKVAITVARTGTDTAPRWEVTVRMAGGAQARRTLDAHVDEEGRWWPTDPATGDGTALAALAALITDRSATAADVHAYGRILFRFLIGDTLWTAVREHADPADVLEFRLSWPAGDGALHRMIWELIHDGEEYLALRDQLPVVLLREVPGSRASLPGDAPISTVPQVLFAVGSYLSDPRVRAGTEFLGVLRAMQRGGGIRQRVLAPAGLAGISAACARFAPQIVHLIGHGRWDEQTGQALLEMRADDDPAATVEVTGPQLLQALESKAPLPVAAVVSACASGVAFSEGGAPLAATLVAGGVPVVVAMAGDIADTACRVFTRAVAAAVSDGLPLTRAVREGRRAAHRQGRTDLNCLDWALPALFVLPDFPERFRLVDTTRTRAVQERVRRLNLDWPPVFVGRDEFFADLDRLLDPQDGLAVLAARTTGAAMYGGTRLLRELAAAALRAGHVPCMIGPFSSAGRQRSQPPAGARDLALTITNQILYVREVLGIDQGWTGETLPLLAGYAQLPAAGPAAALIDRISRAATGADVSLPVLAGPLRRDLFALAAGAATTGDPFTARCRPLLLLDDLHLYDAALDGLLDQGVLGPTGFGNGVDILPTVVFGKTAVADGARLDDLGLPGAGPAWCEVRDVRHFRDLVDEHETDVDLLAYQCWLLNPPRVAGRPVRVLAPRQLTRTSWARIARFGMKDSTVVYDREQLDDIIAFATGENWLSDSDDDEILRAYGLLP
ncbi:CHAT domain-containing protein [Actinoplanes sp. NPDC023936]|uniref:CHAT domain-containing protein n=1 Tax=Actinoplanes sp. NPDC023936 TaxID=3154910 RepID=UPI003409349C